MRGIKITFRVRQFVRISIGGIYTAVGKNGRISTIYRPFFWRRSIDSTCMKREKCFPRIDVFFRTHDFSHPREQDVHNDDVSRNLFAFGLL